MSSSHAGKSVPNSLLTTLQAYLSQDWLTLLFDLYRALRLWANHHRHEGIYEILDYDSTLELMDAKGETAAFSKRQRVKFIQNQIIAFEDYAWGDGEIFADYKCSLGVKVGRFPAAHSQNAPTTIKMGRFSSSQASSLAFCCSSERMGLRWGLVINKEGSMRGCCASVI